LSKPKLSAQTHTVTRVKNPIELAFYTSILGHAQIL